MRPATDFLFALFLLLISALLLTGAYQAGWDAHQKRSDADRAARQRANVTALQRASDEVAEKLNEARAAEAAALRALEEIESYEDATDQSDLCGISVDRLRSLEAIR